MSKNSIDFKPELYKLGTVVLVRDAFELKGELCHITGFSMNAQREILIVVKRPLYAPPGFKDFNIEYATHPSNIQFIE